VRLLVAALAVMLAVLASLGPIVGFFAVCTTSYSFIVLLNVVVYDRRDCWSEVPASNASRMTIARRTLRMPWHRRRRRGGTAAAEPQSDANARTRLELAHARPTSWARTRAPSSASGCSSSAGGLADGLAPPSVHRRPEPPLQCVPHREGNFFEPSATAFSSLF
jgi:hypothetical protein